jgi:hypothetical protein
LDDGDRDPGRCEVIRQRLEGGPVVPAALRACEVRFESRTLRDACYFAWFLPGALLEDALRIEAQRLPPPLPRREGAGGGFEADGEEFLRRWFVPGNATLLVVGDVQPAAVRAAADRYFRDVPWGEPPRRAALPPPSIEHAKMPCAGLAVAWTTPGAADSENAALAVLMQRLCNVVDGPLCRRLTAAGCGSPRWRQEPGRSAGVLVLSVDSARDAAAIETVIQEELERAVRDVPTEIELNRARALAARQVRLSQAGFAERALRIGFYEVVAGDAQLADWELPRVLQVTVGDLQRAAADLRPARTVYGPRVAGGDESAAVAVALHALDLGSAGVRQTIGDSAWITVCTQPAAPLVEVRTLADGPLDLSSALALLTTLWSPRHSAEQIRDYLAYHGLDLFPFVEGTRPGLISRGPSSHVAQMIELQAELLQQVRRILPAVRALDIVVTGDVEERAACDAARAAWSAAPSR